MTRALVQWSFALTDDGVRLGIDRLMDETLIRIGDWYVELRGGRLIVRSIRNDVTVAIVDANWEQK